MNSKNSFVEKFLGNSTIQKTPTEESSERFDSPDFIAKRKNFSATITKRRFSFSDDYKQKGLKTKKEKKKEQIQQKINILNDLSKKELIQKIFEQKVHYQKIIMYLNQSIEQKKDKVTQQKIEIKILKKKLQIGNNNDELALFEEKAFKSNQKQSQKISTPIKKADSITHSINNKCLEQLDSLNTNDSSSNLTSNPKLNFKGNFYQNFFILLDKNELSSSDIQQFRTYVKIQQNLNELQDFNILRNLKDVKDIQLKFKLFTCFFQTLIQQNRLQELQSVCGHSFIVQSIDLLWQLFEEVNLEQRDCLLNTYNQLYQLQRDGDKLNNDQLQKTCSLQRKHNNLLDINALDFQTFKQI